MIKPEQVPDEVVEAAVAMRDRGGSMRDIIRTAINAWPRSYSLAENDSADIRDVAVIILPLPQEASDD